MPTEMWDGLDSPVPMDTVEKSGQINACKSMTDSSLMKHGTLLASAHGKSATLPSQTAHCIISWRFHIILNAQFFRRVLWNEAVYNITICTCVWQVKHIYCSPGLWDRLIDCCRCLTTVLTAIYHTYFISMIYCIQIQCPRQTDRYWWISRGKTEKDKYIVAYMQ